MVSKPPKGEFMKRFVILSAVLLTFAASSVAQACSDDKLCPMMIQKHSKELGLSQKQIEDIQTLRDNLQEDLAQVLTPKQKQKYQKLAADKCDKGTCPMKKAQDAQGKKEK